MEIWASAQVPSPRSDIISQNERRGRGRRRGSRASHPGTCLRGVQYSRSELHATAAARVAQVE